MVVEVVAGLVAGSLALLSDAAHMLTDAGSIALALVAARWAARPPGGRYTFGLGRAEILSAQVNGASLLVLAGVIAVEAVQRLIDPPEVEGAIVLVVGLAGAAVNVGAAWSLSRAERRSLNVEGARAHVLADLYASLGAALAGLLVLTAGFERADGVVALLVAALMVRSGFSLLGQATGVLLEAAPRGLDPAVIGRALAGASGRQRGPRPAHLGGHVGLPGALGARARPGRRRLPRPPRRARAAARRALRARAHHAAGRARAGRGAPRHRAGAVGRS